MKREKLLTFTLFLASYPLIVIRLDIGLNGIRKYVTRGRDSLELFPDLFPALIDTPKRIPVILRHA